MPRIYTRTAARSRAMAAQMRYKMYLQRLESQWRAHVRSQEQSALVVRRRSCAVCAEPQQSADEKRLVERVERATKDVVATIKSWPLPEKEKHALVFYVNAVMDQLILPLTPSNSGEALKIVQGGQFAVTLEIPQWYLDKSTANDSENYDRLKAFELESRAWRFKVDNKLVAKSKNAYGLLNSSKDASLDFFKLLGLKDIGQNKVLRRIIGALEAKIHGKKDSSAVARLIGMIEGDASVGEGKLSNFQAMLKTGFEIAASDAQSLNSINTIEDLAKNPILGRFILAIQKATGVKELTTIWVQLRGALTSIESYHKSINNGFANLNYSSRYTGKNIGIPINMDPDPDGGLFSKDILKFKNPDVNLGHAYFRIPWNNSDKEVHSLIVLQNEREHRPFEEYIAAFRSLLSEKDKSFPVLFLSHDKMQYAVDVPEW